MAHLDLSGARHSQWWDRSLKSANKMFDVSCLSTVHRVSGGLITPQWI
jgi:hypothetical protein